MSITKGFAKFGSRFAFEFFLETMHGPMIEGLRQYLSSISVEDIPAMVRNEKFPSIDKLDFSFIGENIQHIERISLLRMVEFIAEARPDLMGVIQNLGGEGAAYMAKLRQYLLDHVKSIEFKPEGDMVLATCDECKRQWPVPREKAESINECPFCHHKADEKKEPEESEES